MYLKYPVTLVKLPGSKRAHSLQFKSGLPAIYATALQYYQCSTLVLCIYTCKQTGSVGYLLAGAH